MRNHPKSFFEYEPQEEWQFSINALIRLGEFYENRRDYKNALACYWKCMEIIKHSQLDIKWIERKVQRVSKYLRRKRP